MVKGQVLCTQIHATAGIEPISQNSSGSTLGVMMTLDMLTRTYSWPKVCFDVLYSNKECLICQLMKVDCRSSQGLLKPSPSTGCPCSVIWVDFVLKSPYFKEQDSVMFVVDHFYQADNSIPAQEARSPEEMAAAIIEDIFKPHWLPDKIVSDRGSVFMSKFSCSVL